MKKICFVLLFICTLISTKVCAQSWSTDPHCLGIIYIDIDKTELYSGGSEMYLQGKIPNEVNLNNFYMWSMQGLGSPILYSTNGIYFYFSIIKSHLKHEHMFNPNGVFTAELYVGIRSTINFSTADAYYIVQYQINDFSQNS